MLDHVLRALGDVVTARDGQEALERARATLLEAYGNQDVPFERLVSELSPRRDTSVTPLFQSMFSLDSSVGSERSLFGGEASALRGEIASNAESQTPRSPMKSVRSPSRRP